MNEWFEWSDDNVDDHVLGSGAAEASSCIRRLGFGPIAGSYLALMWDPETPAQNKRYTFYRDDVRRIAEEIAEGKHEVNPRYREYIRLDDPDAGTVQVIIQIAAYGEILFSD